MSKNQQPRPDFSALPFDRAVPLLHRIGKALMGPLIQDRPLPDLGGLLAPGDMQLILPPRRFEALNILPEPEMKHEQTGPAGSRMHQTPQPSPASGLGHQLNRIKETVRNALRNLLLFPTTLVAETDPTKIQHRDILASAMAGQLPPDQFDWTLRSRFDLYFGGLDRDFMPADFWKLTGHMAWSDINFQTETARAISGYFKTRVLFTTGQAMNPVFSPNLYWTLITLAGTLPVNKSLSMNRRMVSEAIDRIRETGEAQALKHISWAGFWDQWLIWKAMAWCKPDGFARLAGPFQDAVAGLPIFDMLGTSSLVIKRKRKKSRSDTPPPLITDAEWRKQIPDWFPMYVDLWIKQAE